MSVSAAAADRLNNVPVHLPSMVGREQALGTMREHLLQEGCGLLTLTGPGGSGKTRLALAVAAAVLDRPEFLDGVWVADLAPLNDPLLVPGAVAASVGVQEQPGRPIRDTLLEVLRGCHVLLVLSVDRMLPGLFDLRVVFWTILPVQPVPHFAWPALIQREAAATNSSCVIGGGSGLCSGSMAPPRRPSNAKPINWSPPR